MPYSKIDPDAMILRDHLAYDRTVLANERTLLAYLRTAIALTAGGATLIKVFPQKESMMETGSVLIALGIIAAAVGAWRFAAVKRKLASTYKKLDQ